MKLEEWSNLSNLEQDKLAIKYGISRKGARELLSEAELVKIPEVVAVEEPAIELALEDYPVVVIEKVKKITKKDEKPIKKLGAKLGSKKPAKRSNLKGRLAKKR